MRSVLLWFGLLATSSAPAGIVGVAGGTAAPPPTLGPYTMTAFPPDPRPLGEEVTAVPSPLGGDVVFSEPAWHLKVGEGWPWWGHGYEGDVYRPVGSVLPYTLSLPATTKAFYLYASHDLGGIHNITVTADDGTAVTQPVMQFPPGGAAYFGFYVDDPTGADLKSLTLSMPVPAALAVGEFGIAIPEPGALALLAAGAWLPLLRRR